MSELMDEAVIRMPYEMAMADELSRRQFYDCANDILNRLQERKKSSDADYERLCAALGWGKKFGLPVNHGSYIGQTLHLCKECHESNKAIFENPKR